MKYLLALLLAVSFQAGAGGNNNGPTFGGLGGDTSATAVAGASSSSSSKATGVGVGVGIAGGGSATGGASSSGGNSYSNNEEYPDSMRTTPSMGAPTIGASAPCSLAVSGAMSVMGFGGSFGKSVLDEGCNMREVARVLNQMGKPEAGLKVMCNDKMAAAALGAEVCGVAEPK